MTGNKTRSSTGTKLDHLTEKVDKIYELLVEGDPENNKPGVLERLRTAEDYIRNQRRMILALGLALGTDAITRLWQLMMR